MPTGDILRATIEGTFCGEQVINDLGFISQSGATDFQGDADALHAELFSALDLGTGGGAFWGPLSASYKLTGIRVQDLNPGLAAGVLYNDSSAATIGANDVDDALPPACAICVTWRTALKGKQNRGRSYLTGFAEDSQNLGLWVPEIVAWAANAFAGPLMDAFGPIGTGNYQLAVVHSMLDGARIVPPTATPITSYTVRPEVRTLRRRGVGVRISRTRTSP